MSLSDMIKTLEILMKYYNLDEISFGADYNEIRLLPSYKPMIEEDWQKMYDLGWYQEDVPSGEYIPYEGWVLWV